MLSEEKMKTKNPKTEEHILVCLSASPTSAKIIKTAAQMAQAFGAKLTALYVKTPDSDGQNRESRDRLQSNMHLAEDLGAEILTAYGEDVAEQIIEFTRLLGITKLVLGRSNPSGLILKKHSLTDKIIKTAIGIDIYIIPDTDNKKTRRIYRAFSSVKLPSMKQWGWTFVILALSTVLGYLFHLLHFSGANTIPVYMLGVLITAVLTKSHICSAAFSLLSVLFFDWIFTAPMLSMIPLEVGDFVTFGIMLIASLIMGTLANKLAINARLSANAAYRTKIMLETDQQLQKCDSEEAVINTMTAQLVKLLSRNVIVYPVLGDSLGNPQIFPSNLGGDPDNLLSEDEKNVAQWVFLNRKRAGAGTERFNKSHGVYLSVKTNDAVFFIVGIEVGNKSIEHFENSILISILGEAALAIENLHNAREKEEIALLAKNEKLRADLLRAISHDLRTPLTSISGNSENLLMNYDRIDSETRKRLLTDINDDSEWLISLVANLLSVSRISEGRMNINMSVQVVDEVITEALRHIGRKAKEHNIITDVGDDLLLAKMDARLISQVIINLVENAIKYTPKGSTITVRAEDRGEHIAVSVVDNGAGIPDEQKKDVFRMFYTGSRKVVDCHRSLGLGLSLCESIVSAHGGKLSLSDNQPHCCNFTFTLEKSEVNLGES